MVLGVRVHGDRIEDAHVIVDGTFRAVPVPTECGVPLLYKKMSGTGGDDSHIRSSVIVRMMADPEDGFAPYEWQYGGRMGPAPPVVLARRDQLPFSSQDWDVMDRYIQEWMEEGADAEEGRQDVSRRYLNPEAFRRYVQARASEAPTAFLPVRFPLGSTVVAQGLAGAAELNGQEGEVAQYSRNRLGVRYPDRDVVALRPERLTLLREPANAVKEAAAKQQDSGDEEVATKRRETRQAELQQKESLQICRRFVECLHGDTFPEMPELHLFGLGGDYQARAQEALAVWQQAVKDGDLTAESIAAALSEGRVKTLFEETARKIAKSRVPNATYAKMLIDANFAALEFDDL